MAIIVALALFLLIFFVVRKHFGAALLATIAGLSVYQLFGTGLAAQIHTWAPSWDLFIIEKVIYFALVLVFPLLLYVRSSRGGLFGILRLAEAIIFAVILTSLIAAPLSEILPFDDLSRELATFISSIQGYAVAAGVIGAYLDILLSRSRE